MRNGKRTGKGRSKAAKAKAKERQGKRDKHPEKVSENPKGAGSAAGDATATKSTTSDTENEWVSVPYVDESNGADCVMDYPKNSNPVFAEVGMRVSAGGLHGTIVEVTPTVCGFRVDESESVIHYAWPEVMLDYVRPSLEDGEQLDYRSDEKWPHYISSVKFDGTDFPPRAVAPLSVANAIAMAAQSAYWMTPEAGLGHDDDDGDWRACIDMLERAYDKAMKRVSYEVFERADTLIHNCDRAQR